MWLFEGVKAYYYIEVAWRATKIGNRRPKFILFLNK